METFSALLTLCEGNPPLTNASDGKLWSIILSAPEQAVEQTIETQAIWDTKVFIMTPL